MNIDTKSSIKYLQAEFNKIFKISYTMTKLVSSQGDKDNSYVNQ
jgi:hypothetical protein